VSRAWEAGGGDNPDDAASLIHTVDDAITFAAEVEGAITRQVNAALVAQRLASEGMTLQENA